MDHDDFRIDAALQDQINQARQAGKTQDATQPRAAAAWYHPALKRIFVQLKTGEIVNFPCQSLQGLQKATPE